MDTKGQFDETTPLERLVAAVHTRDHWVRKAAAEELHRRLEPYGTLSPAALLTALAADDTAVRAAAAQILGEMRELTPIPELLGVMGELGDKVRISVAWALAHVGERVSVAAFLSLLNDPISQVRVAVLHGLGERVPITMLLTLLHDSDNSVRLTAARQLGMLGDAAPVGTLADLARDADASMRAAAVSALGGLGVHRGYGGVVHALRDPDDDVRVAAIEALAEWGERMPISHLLPLLDDPAPHVRWQTIRALARVGEPAAIGRIVTELRADAEYARENVFSVLRSGRNSEAAVRQMSRYIPVDALLDCLLDPWWPGAIMAAEFVGALGDAAPLDALLALLHAEEPGRRWAAARALKLSGGHVPIEPLVAALGDDDGNVRAEAAEALERFGSLVPIELLLGALEGGANYTGSVNVQIARALAKRGRQEGIQALVRALADSERRWSAACALGELGRSAPVDPLIAALGDSDAQVRIRAAEALYKTHPDVLAGTVPRLMATLKGERPWTILESIQQTSLTLALSSIRSEMPPLVTYLGELLDWPYWETRMHAAWAVGQLGPRAPEGLILRVRELEHDPQSESVRRVAKRVLEDRAK